MIRIIRVDDHADHRARFRTVIADHADLAVVGDAENGGNALELGAMLHPDVVLMQATMPVVSGIAATRRIRAAYPTVQIVRVTPFFNDAVVEGLRAGAISSLRTDVDAKELVRTIRAAHQGLARDPPLPPHAS